MLPQTQIASFMPGIQKPGTATADLYGAYPQSSGHLVSQLDSYRGWNYVAVKKFSELCAQEFPNLGKVDLTRADESQRVARRQTIDIDRLDFFDRTYRSQGVSLDQISPLTAHVFLDLLRNPNPEESFFDLIFDIVAFSDLTGVAYLWMVPGRMMSLGGQPLPAELTVIPSTWVQEVRDNGKLQGYLVTVPNSDQGQMTLTAEEVMPFKHRNPASKSGWQSVAQSIATWIDGSEAVDRSRLSQINNAGRPGLVLKPNAEFYTKDFTKDQADDLKQTIMSRTAQISKHGQPLVLPPAIEPERWGDSIREMDYLESSNQLRDSIFAARGTSKIIAGMTQDMNRADTEAALTAVCQFAINPELTKIAHKLTKIAQRYDPNLICWYDDCVPRNREMELQEDKADFAMGALTPAEQRNKRNRPEIAHASQTQAFFASNVMPADIVVGGEGDE